MARDVKITVSGDGTAYAQMVERIRQQNAALYGDAQRQAAQAAQSFNLMQVATTRVTLSQRDLGGAVNVLTGHIAQLGPVANLASNAITSMATAASPAGIALGALAVVMGLLASRIEAARERFRELSEIELAGIARATKAPT
jgi:hypothetical protein